MFERFKNRSTEDDGATATTVDGDRPIGRDAPATEPTATHPHAGPVATRETMHRVRARQREEYGGINWGALSSAGSSRSASPSC